MTTPSADRHFLDTPAARALALLVALLAAAVLGWLNREAIMGSTPVPVAALANPQLAACLKERVGAVDKMRDESIINERQYSEFRTRAEDYCNAQFPPE